MYLGTIESGEALHNLPLAFVIRAFEEEQLGQVSRVDVILCGDGSCIVRDDGVGLPVDSLVSEGMSAAEAILTTLHCELDYIATLPARSRQRRSIGVAAATAACARLRLRTCRGGEVHTARIEHGYPTGGLESVSNERNSFGTEVSFLPFDGLFPSIAFDFEDLAARLRKVAAQSSRIEIQLTDERTKPHRMRRMNVRRKLDD